VLYGLRPHAPQQHTRGPRAATPRRAWRYRWLRAAGRSSGNYSPV